MTATERRSTALSDFDFSKLTKPQQSLLTFGGWRVSDAASRPQPDKRTVAKLIERGLVVEIRKQASLGYIREYEVPTAVHAAWCARCARTSQGGAPP